MRKNVLLIGNPKSFMVRAIIGALEAARYRVTNIDLDIYELNAQLVTPDIWILFIEEMNDDLQTVLTYCVENVGRRETFFYMIGDRDNLKLIEKEMPPMLVKRSFERPINNADIIDELNRIVKANNDNAPKKRILVVDDDTTMLSMIKDLLTPKYSVYTADSGTNAITFLVKNRVDLILLDYEMPILSGAQVLAMLRSEPTTEKIPVIMLTVKDDRESVMKVLELKPEKYMLKSMPPNMWVKTIDDYFKMRA